MRRRCEGGEFSENPPTCEGLNQVGISVIIIIIIIIMMMMIEPLSHSSRRSTNHSELVSIQAFSYKLDKPPTILFRWVLMFFPQWIKSLFNIWMNSIVYTFSCSHEDNKYVPIFWRNHHDYFHRHEDGPIAQSNFGELLVFPGATLHMECLSLKVQDILIKYFVILTFLLPEATLHIMCLSLEVLDFWYLNFFIWTFFFIFFCLGLTLPM